jgi:Restriction endonuclease S subunits
LRGLEASELKLSEIENGLRIDAELYKKELVFFEQKIKTLQYSTLGEEVRLIKKGIFDIKAECYSDTGIPFVRISNLKNCVIDTSDIVYIPEEENFKNLSTCLKRDDIILSKTANAAASLVNLEICNTSQDTVAIKLKDNSRLNSHFIVIFLNTKYGLKQMQRWFTGNIQMHLNLEDCKTNLIIPIYSETFQNIIREKFKESIDLIEKSKLIYKNVQNLLLEKLGLFGWKIPNETATIKNFTESFLESGRLDAEYYQPKYYEVVQHVKQTSFDLLGNLVTIKKSIEPGSDAYLSEGVPFIRVADLSKFGLSETVVFLNRNEYDIEALKPRKDTILLSKDGTVGIAYKIEEDIEAVTSGAILHLCVNDKRILPDYLCLVLNSMVVQYQAERDAGGSIIQHWKTDEIKQVVVPILSQEIQIQLKDLVQNSFFLQEKSKQLLDAAKHAVELAIDENENIAIEWLKSQKF